MRLDSERLYWAVLDELPGRAGGEALCYAFEAWLPAPIDEIEARFTRLGDGRTLACGMEKQALQAEIDRAERAGPDIESVRPAGAPAPVVKRLANESEAHAAAERIELRSGTFESPRRARRRRIKTSMLAAMAISVAALLAWANAREARALRGQRDAARAATASLIESVLGPDGASGLAPRLRLDAELRRLRRTRDSAAETLLAEDRAGTLIELLAAWPQNIPTRVDLLQVDQGQIVARGATSSAGDFETLRLELGEFSDVWIVDAASASRGREAFNFTVVLKRRDENTGASP